MSRFDKYGPFVGGFRAPLNAATVAGADASGGDRGRVIPVGLNASGRVVKNPGINAIKGVICPVRDMAAGEMIDVMTDGEIADFTLPGGGAAAAGTSYFGTGTTSAVSTTATGTPLGWTVEATRLVVRVGRGTNATT
jgi:hypothetical protein